MLTDIEIAQRASLLPIGEIASRLGTLALFRPGDPDEWCDYIYVLCLGRTPSVVEIREQHPPGRGQYGSS